MCNSAVVPVLTGFKASRWLEHRLCSHKCLVWVFLLSTGPDILKDGHSQGTELLWCGCASLAGCSLAWFRGVCAVNSPILLSLIPDLPPCTGPSALLWLELPPAMSWAFVVLCGFGPFFSKIVKASLAPKLYITMFYLHSLCVLK